MNNLWDPLWLWTICELIVLTVNEYMLFIASLLFWISVSSCSAYKQYLTVCFLPSFLRPITKHVARSVIYRRANCSDVTSLYACCSDCDQAESLLLSLWPTCDQLGALTLINLRAYGSACDHFVALILIHLRAYDTDCDQLIALNVINIKANGSPCDHLVALAVINLRACCTACEQLDALAVINLRACCTACEQLDALAVINLRACCTACGQSLGSNGLV